MTNDLTVRPTTPADAEALLALHRATAASPRSGLAREPDEVELSYVEDFLAHSTIALSAWAGERIAGEIHIDRMEPRQFAHVLTDLTVAVHPDFQGHGVGTLLFEALFAAARTLPPPKVERIELMVRDGNARAVALYVRLGFVVEGRFTGRVRLKDGTVENDLAMAKLLT